VARDTSKSNVLNLAPAYAPIDGLEISGVLSRDTTNRVNAQSVQAKWRITPSKEKGCNVAAVLGSKATGQLSARTQLTKELQLDGNVSRNDGQTAYSLGVKYQF
jgi:hypothetical protein